MKSIALTLCGLLLATAGHSETAEGAIRWQMLAQTDEEEWWSQRDSMTVDASGNSSTLIAINGRMLSRRTRHVDLVRWAVTLSDSERIVDFFDVLELEHFADARGQRLAGGDKDHARGGGIEAVKQVETLRHGAGKVGRPLVKLAFERVGRDEQRARLLALHIWMRKHDRRLGEGGQAVGIVSEELDTCPEGKISPEFCRSAAHVIRR